MAEQKKNAPLSEENRRLCPHCKRVVSEICRYIEMLDKDALNEVGIKRKRAKYLGCGATSSYKTNDPIDLSAYSEVPRAGVKKCEEQPIGEDKILQSEETEKWVDELQPLSISMERGPLQKRENMKKLLEMMMKKYPQMVATQSEADDEGDFYIYCTECPASFSVMGLAQQHFQENLHDKKSF